VLACAVVLLAGAAGAAAAVHARWFRAPGNNILCQMSYRYHGDTSVLCISRDPPRRATLSAHGRTRICGGVACLSDGPAHEQTLRYGSSTRLGPFTCTSLRTGVRCIARPSRHGFVIAPQGIAHV